MITLVITTEGHFVWTEDQNLLEFIGKGRGRQRDLQSWTLLAKQNNRADLLKMIGKLMANGYFDAKLAST